MPPIQYDRYPPNWLSEIRPRILKRANNCCERCGLKNHSTAFSIMLRDRQKTEWRATNEEAIQLAKDSGWMCDLSDPIIKPVKVILTVAHLDHDESNWDVKDDRLKALCQICHLRYDAKEKAKRTKLKNKL